MRVSAYTCMRAEHLQTGMMGVCAMWYSAAGAEEEGELTAPG